MNSSLVRWGRPAGLGSRGGCALAVLVLLCASVPVGTVEAADRSNAPPDPGAPRFTLPTTVRYDAPIGDALMIPITVTDTMNVTLDVQSSGLPSGATLTHVSGKNPSNFEIRWKPVGPAGTNHRICLTAVA